MLLREKRRRLTDPRATGPNGLTSPNPALLPPINTMTAVPSATCLRSTLHKDVYVLILSYTDSHPTLGLIIPYKESGPITYLYGISFPNFPQVIEPGFLQRDGERLKEAAPEFWALPHLAREPTPPPPPSIPHSHLQ